MAGHSKWKNIRIRKGAQDAKRGKLFTKAAREIIMAARQGGGSPDTNARLRLAIRNARTVSMPNENIERAIKKGAGEADGENYEEVTFEGYGPHGVALMVETLTDNRNRTVPELRHTFGKRGGNLGESGCVAWMFERKGVVNVTKSVADEDTLLEVTLDAEIDDIVDDGDSYCITCDPSHFEQVLEALEQGGIAAESSEVAMLPSASVKLDDVRQAQAILQLVEDLEDNDDVQRVHANFDIPDDVMEQAAG
jgi:YebC/PmpR family DNA-binding regulatory protein